MVLLHGGSGSWTHWIRNIPMLLACGRQVWAQDLPGFGDSASPPSITDRKKDMIIVAGFKVFPNQIEDVVALHPGVGAGRGSSR